MYRNRSFAESSVNTGNIKLSVQDMLFDPQTSGGLLMAVDSADVDALFEELKGKVPSAQENRKNSEIRRRKENTAQVISAVIKKKSNGDIRLKGEEVERI